ncbi:MAG: hypothetical protein NVSMB52_18060 [Chloroflexota bacterium]
MAVARSEWHFAALPPSVRNIRLALFNPHATRVGVWLRFYRKTGPTFRHVELFPTSTRVIHVASNPVAALALLGDATFVPLRLATSHRSVQSDFGVSGPVVSGSNNGQMPHRSWYFAAIPDVASTVLLTFYNPNPFAVDVVVKNAQDQVKAREHLMPGGSRDMNLSFLGLQQATRALIVSGSGDTVPQRTVIGQTGSHSSYGTPIYGTHGTG